MQQFGRKKPFWKNYAFMSLSACCVLGLVLVMGSSSQQNQPAVGPSAPGVPLVQEDAARGQVLIFCLCRSREEASFKQS